MMQNELLHELSGKMVAKPTNYMLSFRRNHEMELNLCKGDVLLLAKEESLDDVIGYVVHISHGMC